MKIEKILFITLLGFATATFFGGCAQKALPASRAGTISQSYHGVVENVEQVAIHGDGTWTSLAGMIAGGLLGHQIGEGSGKDVATMAGTMIGSVGGQQADIRKAQRITVRFDSGKTITTVLPIDGNNPRIFQPGDRVTVFITDGKVTEIR